METSYNLSAMWLNKHVFMSIKYICKELSTVSSGTVYTVHVKVIEQLLGVGLGDGTQTVRLWSKHLYQLSHCEGPIKNHKGVTSCVCVCVLGVNAN